MRDTFDACNSAGQTKYTSARAPHPVLALREGVVDHRRRRQRANAQGVENRLTDAGQRVHHDRLMARQSGTLHYRTAIFPRLAQPVDDSGGTTRHGRNRAARSPHAYAGSHRKRRLSIEMSQDAPGRGRVAKLADTNRNIGFTLAKSTMRSVTGNPAECASGERRGLHLRQEPRIPSASRRSLI